MTKQITNGGFTNPAGGLLTGNLLLVLSQDAKVAAAPNQVAPIATRISISAGNIAPTLIYFNDELLPGNTTYTATAYDAAGNKTYGPEIVSLTGAGPLDLGTLVPLLISPDPLFSNPVLQSPAVSQTIPNVYSFNGALYVGGPITQWSGSDIGAQINSAYAALPPQGGVIYVLPATSSNGTYTYSTPIVLNTVGKYAVIQGLGPSGLGTSLNGGIQLQYTPTTATTAITLDFTPTTGGGFNPGAGLRDLTITNSQPGNPGAVCSTAGGCGSSATGIKTSVTNGGCHMCVFSNVKLQGFGTAVNLNSGNQGADWGEQFFQSNFAFNTTGLLIPNLMEVVNFFGGVFAQNGTAVNSTNTYIKFHEVHFDSNTNTAGGIIQCTGGNQQLTFNAPHFENLGVAASPHYINSTCAVAINGGEALDDQASGSADWWFQWNFGSVNGLLLFSAGRNVTGGSVFKLNASGNSIQVNNTTPSVISNLLLTNNFRRNGVQVMADVSGSNNSAISAAHLYVAQGTAPTCSSTNTGTSSCAIAGADSGGTGTITITAGAPTAAGTATVTFNSSMGGNNSHCSVTLMNNGGSWNARATAIMQTQDTNHFVFNWDNNAVALTATTWNFSYACFGE